LARACQPELYEPQATPLPPSAPERSRVSRYLRFGHAGLLPNDKACVPAHRTLGLRPPHCRRTPAPLLVPSPPPPRSRIVSAESSSILAHHPTFGRESQWPASATARQRLFLSAISLPMLEVWFSPVQP